MNVYSHERAEQRETRQAAKKAVWSRMPDGDIFLFNKMAIYLHSRNLPHGLAVANSWYTSSNAGDNLPRIVIPAINSLKFPFWQARAMVPADKRYQSPKGVPRLDSIIMVWPIIGEPKPQLVITEGPFDALAAAEHGFVSIATMGNTPDDPVLSHIVVKSLTYQHTIILADRDSIDAGYKLAAQLSKRGIKASVSWPETAKDLAALNPQSRKTLLEYAVRKSRA